MASLSARIRVVAIAALPASALGLLVLAAFIGLRLEAAEAAHTAQKPSVAVAVSMSRDPDATRRELALLGGGSLIVLGTALAFLIRLARGSPTGAPVRVDRHHASGGLQRERRRKARRLGEGATACTDAATDRVGPGLPVPEGGREERAAATLAEVAKARFLAAASHDLRQPVHALGLFVNLLERRSHPPETAEIVQRIGQSVKTIGTLLDSLLDISRLDCGAVKPDPRAINVHELFDRLADVGVLTIDKGLGWRVRPSREWIHSDPDLLERALRILLSNALRYTEAGSVMLAARRRGEFLRIEVRDSGIGIDWPSQALVFQEFVQLGNAERDRHKGLGLGLPIVLRLGRLLHHPIGLRSAPGRGSVFWIEAPLAGASGREQRSAPQRGDLVGRKVALIDDDPGLLARAGGLLSAWGCRVYAGRSRRDVERALECTPPDLILCSDRIVGGESGLEAVDRMRLIYGMSIPAVVMTDTDPARMPPLGRRQLSVLAKPLRPAKLRATLRAWLERVAEPL